MANKKQQKKQTTSRRKNKASATQHRINTGTNPHAAGIDIGAEELVVAIPPDRCVENVRTFRSFTADIYQLRDWLLEHKITTVAMESTGNYWVNCYDLLAEAGIDCYLVNARHVKGVPGKKTDVCDAQWLQQLHAAGLLKKSFRPDQDILPLRYLHRYRDGLIRNAGDQLRRMQKVLVEMNLKLHHVFSDIDGTSAQAIINAILAGERDPKTLAALRDGRCKSSESDILAALQGQYRPELLFVLAQLQKNWLEQQKHIRDLDDEIFKLLQKIAPAQTPAENQNPPATNKTKPAKKTYQLGKNSVLLDYRRESLNYYGVDLTAIDGVGPSVLLNLLSEIGNREQLLGTFKTPDSFCAWLTLCPCNAISGGKVLRSATRKTQNPLSKALRLAAFGISNARSKLGEYCRRMKGRLGKAEGITATAHKIARILYALIQKGGNYDEATAFPPKPENRKKQLKQLEILAQKLGIQLPETL